MNAHEILEKSKDARKCCRKHWSEDAQMYPKALGNKTDGYVLMNPLGMPFMLCKTCGNKRCPKATDCDLECTDSNQPGQEGSIYG